MTKVELLTQKPFGIYTVKIVIGKKYFKDKTHGEKG